MKPKTTKKERAAVARLRSALRLTVRTATRLAAKLNEAGEHLPEYAPFSGPTSERAARLLRARSALASSIVAAEDALKALHASGTPRASNPGKPKRRVTKKKRAAKRSAKKAARRR